MPIINNAAGRHTITCDTANVTYTLTNVAVANVPYSADNTVANNDEVVTNVSIVGIAGSGDWTIVRNGNIVFTTTGNNCFTFDFQALGAPLTQQNSSNIVANCATANGTLVMRLSKTSHIPYPV